MGSGKRGRRGGLVEGGIYEIAGHPAPTATTVNSGDRWAVALMYIYMCAGVEKSESRVRYRGRLARARARARVYVLRAQDTPDFGVARGLGETESLKSRDQNAIGRRRSPASPF